MFNTINHQIQTSQTAINDNQFDIDTNHPANLNRENFNQEAEKVKESLSQALNFADLNEVGYRANSNSKYQALVNENNYLKNSNNANTLINNIAFIQSANANINQNNSADSLHDFFSEIKKSIIVGKHDNLDVLKNIFSNYMEYVNGFRDALASLSTCIKPGKKEGTIGIDYLKFGKALLTFQETSKKYITGLENNYEIQRNGTCIRNINNEEIYYNSKDEVEQSWKNVDDLLSSLKGVLVKNEKNIINNKVNEKFNISIDNNDYNKMTEIFHGKINYNEVLQTEFDLFKKSLDAFEKKLNTNLDELSKKYSTANANFDNFTKVVSSAMNTLSEMARGFLRY